MLKRRRTMIRNRGRREGRHAITGNRDLALRQKVSHLARLYIFNQAKKAPGGRSWYK